MTVELLLTRVNALFDSLARPTLPWRGAEHASYQVLGFVGLFAGYALAGALTVAAGLELWVLACLVLLGCLLFLAQGMLYKVLLGYERLAWLEQVSIIVAAAAVLVALLGRPVLPYLDVFILGLGTMLLFGRVGCHMAGCCHGRPNRFGVCYGRPYAQRDLPHYYAGVRLFPIQLLEACITLGIVLGGVWLHLNGAQPGAALVWYVTAYGSARFLLEFARGDSARPYAFGLSLNQWLCAFAVWLLLLAAGRELVPYSPLTLSAGVGLLGAVLVCLALAWRRPGPPLRHPHHVADLYRTLTQLQQRAAGAGGRVVTGQTAGGLRIGLSVAPDSATGAAARHYSFSALVGTLEQKRALEAGRLVAELHRYAGPLSLQRGRRGCYHICLVDQADH